ncbi:MAG: DNA translocase FtsK 4TM domain-containing protein [Puniceicoccaceae bacterium]
MARKQTKRAAKTPTFGPKDPEPRPFIGLAFLILGLLIALAVWDYSPEQNKLFYSDLKDQNIIGNFGVQVAYYLLFALGLAAYATPFLAFWMSYMFFRPYSRMLGLKKVPPIILILISAAVIAFMYQVESLAEIPAGKVELSSVSDNMFPYGWGGWLGYWVYGQFLKEFLGMVGSLVVFGVLSIFSLAFLLFDNVGKDIRLLFQVKTGQWAESRAERAAAREKRKAEKRAKAEQKQQERLEKRKKPELAEALPGTDPRKKEEKPKVVKRSLSLGREDAPEPFEPILEDDHAAVAGRKPKPAKQPHTPPEAVAGPISLAQRKTPAKKAGAKGSNLRIIAGEETRKAAAKLPERRGNYKFPPMRLLAEPKVSGVIEDDEIHQQTADMLVKTLEEFGVRVTTGDVHTGPVITRYDVYPAAGVRVEKILNLDKNIALSLKAMSVRILAPVPGKGCVGIEVPNKQPQSVFIRDILESEDWVNNKAEIPIALGKEVSGKPLIADLTKMPHLLIAGSTGSGKTVCINSVITSLLYHSSPEDIRFVMVDPKIVEMQVYNSLPHMLVPVVTDPKKVPNALKYLLNEMERRYQLFAGIGVRNIAGYNAKMAKSRKEAAEAEIQAAAIDAEMTPEERAAAASIEVPRDPDALDEAPTKLPYIVCIVDELADLMMVAPADIETGIARLAQLARAAGIHLILATQRPSVNVITGVIKANLPSRISFKVASKVDSRTILDTMGADHLIGKGDMLFLPPGSADLVRAQGAFVGDDEITNIVHHIRDVNGEPEFDEHFQRNIDSPEEAEGGASGDYDDDLVPAAIDIIRTSKRASTSFLQRKLKIGYNRAARIMEILEDEGIVGPENGSSPREILIDQDY